MGTRKRKATSSKPTKSPGSGRNSTGQILDDEKQEVISEGDQIDIGNSNMNQEDTNTAEDSEVEPSRESEINETANRTLVDILRDTYQTQTSAEDMRPLNSSISTSLSSISTPQTSPGSQGPSMTGPIRLVSKGSSGIGPKTLPPMTYELRSADNYEEWRKALEAYSLAHNSWILVFEPHNDSLNQMMRKYSSWRTSEDIILAHDEWCGKLFGIMYQSVMKLTGDVLLGELRSLQSTRTTDILADPNHLLRYISIRYEKLSCFSRANEFMKVFSMTYDPNQNPAEIRERLLTKIIRFQNGDANKISEEMKMTIIYNTIPSNLQPLIRGYISNKTVVTFDDVYNALKLMYDEKKSKGQTTKQDQGDLTRKEKRVLALMRNNTSATSKEKNDQRNKPKVHCWYCDSREHWKSKCPKVNEDRKKGLDVKLNPFKPKDVVTRREKQRLIMAIKNQKEEADGSDEDGDTSGENSTKRIRFNMCILNLESLQITESGSNAQFVAQIIDHRILNSRRLHLDSGAFMHITSDRTILVNIRKLAEPIPLTGAFGQGITYVKEVGDLVLNLGVRFREVGIVPNAHMTLISEARIQEAGYGINKPPGKPIAQIYSEEMKDNKVTKKIIMQFEKDRVTDLWAFTMQDGHQTPQERYLEQSGMVRFKPKGRIESEEEKKESEQDKRPTKIPKRAVQQKGGPVGILKSSESSAVLPKNRRKRE